MDNEKLPIVVIGGGGHAKMLLNLLRRLSDLCALGYLSPDDRGPLLDFPWLGTDEQLKVISGRHRKIAAAIGIGKVKADGNRLTILQSVRDAGFLLPPIIAPTAIIAPDVVLGEGAVICDGAILQPGCQLGAGVIVNTGAIVDHDCALGDDVHVAPGATLSGGVTIGNGSMIGVGACCAHGLRIGASCMIGAGAAVVSDCLTPGTYRGVPARFVLP